MSGQLGFAEAFIDPNLGSNARLERIDGLIDWARLMPLLDGIRSGETGRPPYDALSMLKALYLQSLYDLSDPGLEEALLDRLSFRRFCAIGLDERTPDETTICRFRGEVARAGILEACFAEVNRQLDAKGLITRKGTLTDASLVKAQHRPPSHKEGQGAVHPGEPGADWTRKNGQSHFGYRIHIGVDEGSGLIRKAIFLGARTQDVEVFEDLVCGDEKSVYADRGYESKKHRATLKAHGIKDRIMHRRHKYMTELPPWQEARNRLIARRRAPVEAVFSAMKRLYGKGRARCSSLERNAADYIAFATIYNLRRATILTG
jgi:IS5 family transposase